MKNSTLNSINSPISSRIKNLFCIIDEYGALGKNPKTHPSWEEFTRELKAKHSESIAGIIIFSYHTDGRISFSFMLYPKEYSSTRDGLIPDNKFNELIEVFKINKGRVLEEFVSI